MLAWVVAFFRELFAAINASRGRQVAAGAGVMALASVSVYIGSATVPSSEPTANLWVDTNGGTCSRDAEGDAEYVDGDACSSFSVARDAATSGDTVRVKTGTYPKQGSFGHTSKEVTYIGEDGAIVDSGTVSGSTISCATPLPNSCAYNTFNLSGKATVENVDVTGDYPIVQIRGDGNTWRDSELTGREIRLCNSDEPILIQDGGSAGAYTITNNTLENIVIGQFKGSLAGEGGCPVNDPFHLEQLRIGPAVDGLVIDRVTFSTCPNGAGFGGCGSGQILFDPSGNTAAMMRNITIKNSKFYGAVNFHMQANQNVGTSNLALTIAYNTFSGNEPFTWNASPTGIVVTGNLGSRPQNCTTGHTWTKNVWEWSSGSPCGSDTFVSGSANSTANLGVNADKTLAAGSPAIDAGEAAGYCTGALGSIDFTGGPRPVGSACDAGSDERD